MNSRRAILPGALTVMIAAIGLAACGSNDKKSASSKPTALSITTSDAGAKRFAMQAPKSIKGGLVTIRFQNASKAPHEAQLVRIEGSHSVAEVLKTIDTDGPVKIPEWLRAEGGVAATPPGKIGATTLNLPAGRYLVTDTETGDNDNATAPSRLGALAEVTVTSGTDGALPAAASTIKVVDHGKDEYRFQASNLKAGSNTLLFDNQSKEALHHVVAFPFKGNATIDDVKKTFEAFFAQKKPSGPPPLDFSAATGTSVIDGGRSMVTTLKLRKGRYALVCFLNDRDELKPHFMQGLLQEVTVR